MTCNEFNEYLPFKLSPYYTGYESYLIGKLHKKILKFLSSSL